MVSLLGLVYNLLRLCKLQSSAQLQIYWSPLESPGGGAAAVPPLSRPSVSHVKYRTRLNNHRTAFARNISIRVSIPRYYNTQLLTNDEIQFAPGLICDQKRPQNMRRDVRLGLLALSCLAVCWQQHKAVTDWALQGKFDCCVTNNQQNQRV